MRETSQTSGAGGAQLQRDLTQGGDATHVNVTQNGVTVAYSYDALGRKIFAGVVVKF